MLPLPALRWARLAGVLVVSVLALTPAMANSDAQRLYSVHCVQCHGVSGDGQGTTKLDRPARSFKDGGFSFGNTKEALSKTIAYGIPGSQMPAFEAALKPEERALLAEYVLSFAPESARAPVARGTELPLLDKPLAVRGKLPAIEGHAALRVRGLLLGDPSGLSFEYDAAEVRLVAVRRGAFVDRRDWENRGGDALRPLGRIVSLRDLSAGVWLAVGAEGSSSVLRAELASTHVDGAHPKLVYRLQDERGLQMATVTETVASCSVSAGAGFVRRLWLEASQPVQISLLVSSSEARSAVDMRRHGCLTRVSEAADASGEMLVVRGCDADELLSVRDGALRVPVRVSSTRPRLVAVETYPLAVVNAAAAQALAEECP